MASATMAVRVTHASVAAEGILLLELAAADGANLPPFTAGAHIDVYLDNGVVRPYSLMNPQDETGHYLIAVQREPQGRGGSRFLHEHVRAGSTLRIGAPRNNFALAEDAPHSVLVGGGIGVTPLVSMACRLEALGRSWRMHYCARTRRHAVAREQLAAFGDKVRFNFDQEPGGRMLDLAGVVAEAPPGTHFYCCGPAPMLQAFARATEGLPRERVHVEHFSAPSEPQSAAHEDRAFQLVLERTGRSFTVPAGRTVLDTLIDEGFELAFSCREGVCGACETRVLAGTPLHRDLVLSEAEKAAGQTMFICCSRAASDTLVLDL